MIDAKQTLTGTINASQSLTGELNKTTEYIQPILQEKEVMPTKEKQKIICDTEYDGLSKVTVNKIPDEYVIPRLSTKTITKNGIYKAIDDNLDGYSEVDVETSGVDIYDYFIEKYNFAPLLSWIKKIPVINITNIARMNGFFTGATNLIELPQLDFSNATLMANCFNNCIRLVTIPQINAHKVINIYYAFYECRSLENFGGMNNLGESYPTTISENNSSQTLDLSYATKLTHNSLMNVINGLYDIATKGVKPQQLILGSTNLAKLTEDEIKIAQDKGWNVS